MSTLRGMLRMLVPSVTIFFASGCIVVLELVAARLVARDLGSSLYTWTAILGVVLAGLCVGTYGGGRAADRYQARRALAVLFGLSSAACVGVVVLNHAVGRWLWLWRLHWPVHVSFHVALVFLWPAVLLGAIGPVVAKMALDRNLGTGRTVGTLQAWAAAGAIVGVFLAGYFLIPRYGCVAIIWALGAGLLAMGLLYWVSCWALHLWAIIFGALATMGMAPADWALHAGVSAGLREAHDPNLVLYEDQTSYSYVQVRRVSQQPDRRALWLDQDKHGEMVVGDATNLQSFPAKVYAGLTRGRRAPGQALTALVFGAGSYAFPQYLRTLWPDSRVDVVQADSGVTSAAVEALGVDPNLAVETIHTDARSYVEALLRFVRPETTTLGYDVIFADSATGQAVSFERLTKEFNEKIAKLLVDDGLYLLTLRDAAEGGRFLGTVLTTLEQTFPFVYAISSDAGHPSHQATFIVAATRRPLDPEHVLRRYNEYLPFRLLDASERAQLKAQAEHFVLTDDYAPVEHLLASVVQQRAAEGLASRYLWLAETAQRQGQGEASIARYRQAMEANPLLSIRAWTAIGQMRIGQGDLEGATEAFEQAIDFQARNDLEPTAVAPVHMRLGFLLRRLDRAGEARAHLAQAVKWFRIDLQENPNSAVTWLWLGEILTVTRDFKGAADAFARVTALEPDTVTHYEKWAKVLELQHRYDEAIDALRKQIDLLKRQGQREQVRQVGQYIDLLEYEKVKRQK